MHDARLFIYRAESGRCDQLFLCIGESQMDRVDSAETRRERERKAFYCNDVVINFVPLVSPHLRTDANGLTDGGGTTDERIDRARA